MSLVETTVQDRVAVLTLNDPARRNAMSLAMAENVVAALNDLQESGEIGALVLTGAPPAFSAGANLDDLENADSDSLRRIYEGFLAVSRFRLPTIAAVNGAAVGAGLNLALACDLRIAGKSARFDSRFARPSDLRRGRQGRGEPEGGVTPEAPGTTVNFSPGLDREIDKAFGQDSRCDAGLMTCRFAAGRTTRARYLEGHISDGNFVALPSRTPPYYPP
jgi:hypothetical protein